MSDQSKTDTELFARLATLMADERRHLLALIEKGTILECSRPDAHKTPENAAATRKFEVRNIMIGHCGQSLTPDNVDTIAAEMLAAIETGPCAWAFGQNSDSTTKVAD